VAWSIPIDAAAVFLRLFFVERLSSYTEEVFIEVRILTNGVLLQLPIQQMVLAEISAAQARELYNTPSALRC
jgi:hypothetical protein